MVDYFGKMVVLRDGRVVGPMEPLDRGLKKTWQLLAPQEVCYSASSWWTIEGRWNYDGRTSPFDIVAIVDDSPSSLEDYM